MHAMRRALSYIAKRESSSKSIGCRPGRRDNILCRRDSPIRSVTRAGTQGATMKVPFAKQWQKETDALRKIALAGGLTEALKWGKPCFTWQNRNVAIIIPLKESCAFSFVKGSLLKDPERILQRIGQSQAGRWIKFTSVAQVSTLSATLSRYLKEAVRIEQSGRKVALKKISEYAVPEAAFEALTPGRRKSYIFHVAGATQAKTREARAARCVPAILSGRGFNEAPD